MKKSLLILLLGVLIISLGYSADLKKKKTTKYKTSFSTFEDVDIDIDDGTIVMIYKDNDDVKVEITEDYELYIDNEKVKINKDQRKLVKEYYFSMMLLIDEAKTIGLQGAEIGVEGAKMGLKAVANVFKLLSSDYDTDDLEREMEEEADKLEEEAEKLEKFADKIEERADELERLHDKMIDEIPELEVLDY